MSRYTIVNNDKQFKQLAFQYYDNPRCIAFDEFESDLKLFASAASAIEKYVMGSDKINERLLLNRIIIVHNMFGQFTVPGLFYKVSANCFGVLKTCLVFLRYLPNDNTYKDIAIDDKLLKLLRGL